MAKNKGGAKAPRFAFLETPYFKVTPHPKQSHLWVVTNINDKILSINNLPIIYYNGVSWADAMGESKVFGFCTKEEAEEAARDLNERVITGWSVYFDDKTPLQRVWDIAKYSVLFWMAVGMFFTGITVAAVWGALTMSGR